MAKAATIVALTQPTFYRHWTEIPEELWRWPNFRPAEIACRGTGEILVNPDALDRLQQLRHRLGRPVMVNSAYRSRKHNATIKGAAKDSLHLQGIAFDISMQNHDPHLFEAEARAAGFTGFGFYPQPGAQRMHIDMGPSRTWGDPFPPTATPFAPEAPRARPDLKGSRTVTGAKIAAGGAAAAEALSDPEVRGIVDQATGWSSALPDTSTLKLLLWGLAALGIGLVLYARWDDWKKGKR